MFKEEVIFSLFNYVSALLTLEASYIIGMSVLDGADVHQSTKCIVIMVLMALAYYTGFCALLCLDAYRKTHRRPTKI